MEDSDDFANCIDGYMAVHESDLLVISFYDRGKVKNMFHGTIVKELSEIARYPLLINHITV